MATANKNFKKKVVKKRSSTNKSAPDLVVVVPSLPKVANQSKTEALETSLEEYEMWLKPKLLLKPPNQLELTVDELKEEIARVLTIENPQIQSNPVEYSFKERSYLPVNISKSSNFVELMDIEPFCILKNSEEGQQQKLLEGWPSYVEEDAELQSLGSRRSRKLEDGGDVARDDEELDAMTVTSVEVGGGESAMGASEEQIPEEFGDETKPTEVDFGIPTAKILLNKFNFHQQASLTYHYPTRQRGLQALPPPHANFSAVANQGTIYDAYEVDFNQQQLLKETEKYDKELHEAKMQKPFREMLREEKAGVAIAAAKSMQDALFATKLMERIVNQNTLDEIAQYCRHWDDPTDEFVQQKGSLFPLWKFFHEKTRGYMVTSLTWSARYHDLFAASFGSFDLRKPTPQGLVCLFTLKNPSYAEYTFFCETGAMCVDIHPRLPQLLAVGSVNGQVDVYDVIAATGEPQFADTANSNKHDGLVSRVVWGPDTDESLLNFFSLGADGYVFNWVLMKGYLSKIKIILLHLEIPPIVGPDGTFVTLSASGTSMAFHPSDPHIFVVGTREGAIFKCCTQYVSSPLQVNHNAHSTAVNKLEFNRYCHDIFISCSVDWRVKIWEKDFEHPLYVFEIGGSVVDVAWAPYSSTVFAAVSADGRVFVFDINESIYEPLCVYEYTVHKRLQHLTRLAFNPKLPFILVGNEKGRITSYKLSPNLRKKMKPPKKGVKLTPFEQEVMKLEKVLNTAREERVLKPLSDIRVSKEATVSPGQAPRQ